MPYLIVFLLALLFTYQYDIKRRTQGKELAYFILFLSAVLLAGCRYVVGGDTVRYMRYWEDYPTFSDGNIFYQARFDPLWTLLSVACKSVCDDFIFFQFVHAVLLNGILFLGVFKKQDFFKRYRFTIVLFYLLYAYIYFNTEVLRESLAVAFFLLAFPAFQEKKWARYYLFAIVAFLFHTSAIVVFLFPFFRSIPYKKKYIIALFVTVIIIFLFLNNLLDIFLLDDAMKAKYGSYDDSHRNLNGKIFYFIKYFAVVALLIYINDVKLKKKSAIYTCFYVINAFIAAISIGNPAVGGRFYNYIWLLVIGYYVYVLYNISYSKYFSIIRKRALFLFIMFPLLFYYEKYFRDESEVMSGTLSGFKYYPYTSIFQKDDKDSEYLIRKRIYYVDALQLYQMKYVSK